MPDHPVKLHEDGDDDSAQAMTERATLLYWNSDRSVNSIAEDLGLSKGRLYEVIRPMASGSECPNCQSDLVFHNRTARDKGDAECPECGSTADAEPIPPPRALDPTTDTRGIVAGLLVGAAAGLLIGRFLRG